MCVVGSVAITVVKEENVAAEVSVLVGTVVAEKERGLATQQAPNEFQSHAQDWKWKSL